MLSAEIRKLFLKFFEDRDHRVVPSAPLVPHGDPTLLFTSAGMVQFKPYFLGEARPPHPRLTSCQKCFRTSDIESVGDTKHLTLFEMLGNFSVGDYFKKEAIAYAWEFVTRELGLPPERLWVTVFLDDDEAYRHWRAQGVPEERIRRFGEEDNFWGPAGDTGPCGPCSELHYDFGVEHGCGRASCGPNCDCPRFLEIWNLVFMQFYQDREGKRTPLPRPNIDTGMGLERISAVLQGKVSLYDADLFVPLIQNVSGLAGYRYGGEPEKDRACRVVAEHARGIAFLIADGVVPENEGRGYVLRRLLRRAALFGRRLGLTEHFLGEVAKEVISQMAPVYPEVERSREAILRVIALEEERFARTLEAGVALLEDILIPFRANLKGVAAYLEGILRVSQTTTRKKVGQTWEDVPIGGSIFEWLIIEGQKKLREVVDTLSEAISSHWLVNESVESFRHALRNPKSTAGEDAQAAPKRHVERLTKLASVLSGRDLFVLYDTYGFPPELTQEVARENGFEVDMKGFEAEMEKHRERSRAASRFGGTKESQPYERLGIAATTFVGYETLSQRTEVIGLLVDGEPASRAAAGQEMEVVLRETPFWGVEGGQVGDSGVILGSRGRIEVSEAFHPLPELTVHRGKVAEGEVSLGEEVKAQVDGERRLDIARNHSATHLLQAALRQVLGEHVAQRGSLVAPDRLRFDFSHWAPLSPEELSRVQAMVNEKVRQNLPLRKEVLSYQEAMSRGAIALFGEKYGDRVRMVSVEGFSAELCGGTHLGATGEIGYFHIVSEASIGAGLRRIEAVTGRGAEAFIGERLRLLEAAARELGAAPEALAEKAKAVVEELEQERRRSRSLEWEVLKARAVTLEAQGEAVNGIKVVTGTVKVSSMEALRKACDLIRDDIGSGVVVLGAVMAQKPSFCAMVTPDLVARGLHAGNIVREVAKVAGGGGGGKPEMAQAGGKDPSKLDQALREVPELVRSLARPEG